MPSFFRLGVAAAMIIAIGGLILTQILPATPSGNGALPSTAPSPSASVERAGVFVRPFTYRIDPADPLAIMSAPDREMYQFRHPDPSDPTDMTTAPAVVVVRTVVDGLRHDVCRPDGGIVDPSPDAQGFVDFMSSVDGLAVQRQPDTIIDGRTALVIDVTARPERECRDLWLYAGADSFTCCTDDRTIRHMRALDVDGTLVLVVTPYFPEDPPVTLPLAQTFIDTMHFEAADASPGPG